MSQKEQACPYCGAIHLRTVCPLVKAIEYHPNGTVKRVEFKEASPHQWQVPPSWQAPVIS